MEDGIDIYRNYILPAATGVKNAAISLFKSDDAPGDYSSRRSSLARQQKLAEALSQMGAQEQAVSTAGGIIAPVSPIGALARGLTSFGGSYLSGKAAGDEAGLRKQDLADAMNATKNLYVMPAGSRQPDAGMIDTQGVKELGESFPITGKLNIADTVTTPQQQMQMLTPLAAGGDVSKAAYNAYMPGVMKQQAADVELKKQLDRLGPLISNLPVDQQKNISRLAAVDPQSAVDLVTSTLQSQYKPPAPTDLSNAIRERDALSPGDPNIKTYNNLINKMTTNQPNVNQILLPALNALASGQPLTPEQTAVLSTLRPNALLPTTPTTIDPKSQNLTAQTGLSSGAIDYMMGRQTTKAAPVIKAYNKEITDWGIKNNIDTSTLKYQAPAIGKVLDQNIIRNNQANILENEISGSVENLAPLLDAAHRGNLAVLNKAGKFVATNFNDQTSIQASDQLNRLTSELAGYNAAAGGHLGENGTPQPTAGDFEEARNLISSGLNAGGANAIAQSVAKSAAKNRVVLANAIDDAQKQQWTMLGLGDRYQSKRVAAPGGAAKPGAYSDLTDAQIKAQLGIK